MGKKKSKASKSEEPTAVPAIKPSVPKSKGSGLKLSTANTAAKKLAPGSKTSDSKASIAAPAAEPLIPLQDTDQVLRCVENVALLDRLTHSLPRTEPHITAAKAQFKSNNESTRQLTFEQEDRLVKQLAFLSGISDDPNHIIAVCIQELPAQNGCEILVAVNKGSPDSAHLVLEKAQRGLQHIFERLREISPTSSHATKKAIRETVFNDIVALSRERILSRMRSSKYKASWYKRQKCFVGSLLRDASKSSWRQRVKKQKPNMTELELESYDRRIQRLLEAMESFEALEATPQQPHQDLVILVRKIAHFNRSTPFRDLLAPISDLEMPKTSRERLLSCLEKIARYREIAKFLCREAETVSMLRNATIESLKLPAETFARFSGIAYNGTVASALDRVSSKEKSVRGHMLPSWLRATLKATSGADFASDVQQTLREAKIHAEIQILTHYEGAATAVLRPRVIASSKDACYLCHTLISLHGQYRVPKTHGKLYKGWRLPAARIPESLQQRLNEFLEQQIRLTVERLRGRKGLPGVKYANESTLFPLAVSASLLSGMTMPNLSIVSNHSRLDLTALAPAAKNTSQASFQALGTRISGISLQPSRPGPTDVGGSGPCVVDRGSNDDQESQRGDSVVPKSAQRGKSFDSSDQMSGLVDRATDSNVQVDAPVSSVSPFDRPTSGQNAGDDKSVRSASISCDSQVELRGDSAILFEPASTNNDWFRYKKLDFFIDESSAKFSHKRLSTSEAVMAVSSNIDLLCDVRALAVGAEIDLPKDRHGNAYFKCGDEAVKIDARHR